MLLPARLPAGREGSGAAGWLCSEAGCLGGGFSQLCPGPSLLQHRVLAPTPTPAGQCPTAKGCGGPDEAIPPWRPLLQ